jgi:cytoskeletal protein CcmA (bactofilin family)
MGLMGNGRRESVLPQGIITETVLGPGAHFEGKLTFQGKVRIDGRFSGDIVTSDDDSLFIGEHAEVKANIKVGSLEMNGTLRGTVKAKRVELHAPARMYGEIETPNLIIHTGVMFEGTSRMDPNEAARPEILKRDDKREEAKPS